MGMPAVLNLEALTSPIAGQRAAGADLRGDGVWLQIKDARGQARALEREASKAGTTRGARRTGSRAWN